MFIQFKRCQNESQIIGWNLMLNGDGVFPVARIPLIYYPKAWS